MPIPGFSPYRPPRPRPINPFDNAATTGLPSNPNGTYVANPFPTTAASGQQGAFGAGLPQVNVGNNLLQPSSVPNVPMVGYIPPVATPTTGAPGIPFVPMVGYIPPATTSPTTTPATSTRPYTPPTTTMDPGPLYQGGGGVLDSYNYMLAGVADRITNNPAEYDNLSPAQKDAIDNLIAEKGGGGGAGATSEQALGQGDFYGYERDPETGRSVRVVKNAANGDNFMNEMRYDPQTKKMVSIGKLIKQGKLDLQGNWNKRGNKQHQRRQGGGRRNPVQAGPAETTGGFTGSYGVISFNTGTG
jgi:hypothetical protein